MAGLTPLFRIPEGAGNIFAPPPPAPARPTSYERLHGDAQRRMDQSRTANRPEVASEVAEKRRLAEQIRRARVANYTDEEIISHLATTDPRVRAAAEAGYEPSEIFNELVTVKGADPEFNAEMTRSLQRGVLAMGEQGRAYQNSPEEQKVQSRSWIGQRAADFIEPGAQSVSLYGRGLGNVFTPDRPLDVAGGTLQQALGGLGTVGAPVSGAINLFTAPIARAGARQGYADPATLNAAENLALTPLSFARGPNAFAQLARVPAALPQAASGATRVGRSLAKVAPDTATLNTRAAELRNMDIQPTLVDVGGERVRGRVGAAALRDTPGRDVARDFAEARTLNAPDRASRQARAVMSQDPRTPDQIREEITQRRNATADQQFGAVRDVRMTLTPEATSALRTDYGKAAIREAAARERDPDTRRALLALADQALDNPGEAVTVGMMDRVSRVLLGRAQAAARAGDNDLAATYRQLGNDVRNAPREVPGYSEALQNYGAESRLSEAAAVGEDFTRRNTDEFVSAVSGLTPEEQAVARAAARRAVERSTGENPSTAAGTMSRIANAPEQQARNTALLGPEGAVNLQNRMRAEADVVRNAQQINPRAGSPTAPRLLDQQAADNIGALAQGVKAVATADAPGFVRVLWGRLKTIGMSDADAEEIVRLSTDPARLPEAIQLIEAARGPQARVQFMEALREIAGSAVQGALPTAGTAAGISAATAQ